MEEVTDCEQCGSWQMTIKPWKSIPICNSCGKEMCLKSETESGANVPLDRLVMPCGLTEADTIEDALKRADSLAGVDWLT